MTSPLIRFNWTDLETTGLDRNKHSILEICSILTDVNLETVGMFQSIIIPDCYDGTTASLGMDDYVTDMHTKNGLLAEIENAYNTPGGAEKYSMETVTTLYLDWLSSYGLTAETPKYAPKNPDTGERDYTVQTKPYLAGSTMGPFDKPFLDTKAPAITSCMHHHVLNISSLKVATEAWRTDVDWPRAAEAHRAEDDIRESIEHMKVLRDRLLQGSLSGTQMVIGHSNIVAAGDMTITNG